MERDRSEGVFEKPHSCFTSPVLCAGFLWICLTGSVVHLLAVISHLSYVAQFLEYVNRNSNALAKYLRDVDISLYAKMENVSKADDTLTMHARVPPITLKAVESRIRSLVNPRIPCLDHRPPFVGARVSGTQVCKELADHRLLHNGLSGPSTRDNFVCRPSQNASSGFAPQGTRIPPNASSHLRNTAKNHPISSLPTSGEGYPPKYSVKTFEKSVRGLVSAQGTGSRVQVPTKTTSSSVEPSGVPDKTREVYEQRKSLYLAQKRRLLETPIRLSFQLETSFSCFGGPNIHLTWSSSHTRLIPGHYRRY